MKRRKKNKIKQPKKNYKGNKHNHVGPKRTRRKYKLHLAKNTVKKHFGGSKCVGECKENIRNTNVNTTIDKFVKDKDGKIVSVEQYIVTTDNPDSPLKTIMHLNGIEQPLITQQALEAEAEEGDEEGVAAGKKEPPADVNQYIFIGNDEKEILKGLKSKIKKQVLETILKGYPPELVKQFNTDKASTPNGYAYVWDMEGNLQIDKSFGELEVVQSGHNQAGGGVLGNIHDYFTRSAETKAYAHHEKMAQKYEKAKEYLTNLPDEPQWENKRRTAKKNLDNAKKQLDSAYIKAQQIQSSNNPLPVPAVQPPAEVHAAEQEDAEQEGAEQKGAEQKGAEQKEAEQKDGGDDKSHDQNIKTVRGWETKRKEEETKAKEAKAEAATIATRERKASKKEAAIEKKRTATVATKRRLAEIEKREEDLAGIAAEKEEKEKDFNSAEERRQRKKNWDEQIQTQEDKNVRMEKQKAEEEVKKEKKKEEDQKEKNKKKKWYTGWMAEAHRGRYPNAMETLKHNMDDARIKQKEALEKLNTGWDVKLDDKDPDIRILFKNWNDAVKKSIKTEQIYIKKAEKIREKEKRFATTDSTEADYPVNEEYLLVKNGDNFFLYPVIQPNTRTKALGDIIWASFPVKNKKIGTMEMMEFIINKDKDKDFKKFLNTNGKVFDDNDWKELTENIDESTNLWTAINRYYKQERGDGDGDDDGDDDTGAPEINLIDIINYIRDNQSDGTVIKFIKSVGETYDKECWDELVLKLATVEALQVVPTHPPSDRFGDYRDDGDGGETKGGKDGGAKKKQTKRKRQRKSKRKTRKKTL